MADLVQLCASLRECLPTSSDGPDHSTYCTVLGSDLRAACEAVERLTADLLHAQIPLADRKHPASEPRDSGVSLATLGFWPECGCGECYAIHCLGNALAENAALRTDIKAKILAAAAGYAPIAGRPYSQEFEWVHGALIGVAAAI